MKRLIRIKSIASFLIVIVYVLDLYLLPLPGARFTLGYIGLAIIILCSLGQIGKVRRKKIEYAFLLYFVIEFVYAIIFFAVQSADSSIEFIKNWIQIAMFVYIVDISAVSEFDSGFVQRTMVRVGTVLSVSLILQAILDLVFHIRIFPYLDLSFLPISYKTVDEIIQSELRSIARYGYYRYCTIFPEPSYFARYVLLSLIVAMYGKGNGLTVKERKLSCAVILISLFLCRSANGIFTVVLILIIWAVSQRKISLRKAGAIVVFAIAGVAFLLSTDYMQEAVDRLMTITARNGTTGTQRLLQGIAVYSRLPAMQKIFGVGFGNVNTYMSNHNIITAFVRELGNDYMNGFSRILVAGGAVGLLAYILILVKLFFKYKSPMSRMIFLLLCIQFATSNLFYSCILETYYVMIKCSQDNKRVCLNSPI